MVSHTLNAHGTRPILLSIRLGAPLTKIKEAITSEARVTGEPVDLAVQSHPMTDMVLQPLLKVKVKGEYSI